MLKFIIKALLSGLVVAAVATIARRYPGFGGLVASLPLVSLLGMIWLWQDTHDPVTMAAHARATFWFVLPSLPMFLLIPTVGTGLVVLGGIARRLHADRRALSQHIMGGATHRVAPLAVRSTVPSAV